MIVGRNAGHGYKAMLQFAPLLRPRQHGPQTNTSKEYSALRPGVEKSLRDYIVSRQGIEKPLTDNSASRPGVEKPLTDNSASRPGTRRPLDALATARLKRLGGGDDPITSSQMAPFDPVCASICQFCEQVISRRWSALCHVQCVSGGKSYDACVTVWTNRHDIGHLSRVYVNVQ